jgi:hypothetical protein
MKFTLAHSFVLSAFSLLGPVCGVPAQTFSIDRFAISGGGASGGGAFTLNGTLGQPAANAQPLSGGNFWRFKLPTRRCSASSGRERASGCPGRCPPPASCSIKASAPPADGRKSPSLTRRTRTSSASARPRPRGTSSTGCASCRVVMTGNTDTLRRLSVGISLRA